MKRHSLKEMNLPAAAPARFGVPGKDIVADVLDSILAVFAFVLLVYGAAYAVSDTAVVNLLFFQVDDPQAWWEILKNLGATAAIVRGGYWVGRKISGQDKYRREIWKVLDEAPASMSKAEIKSAVRKRIGEPLIINPFYRRKNLASVNEGLAAPETARREEIFERKFEAAWIAMRQKKVIRKHEVQKSAPVYSLDQDALNSEKEGED